jgi:hypothetical protein
MLVFIDESYKIDSKGVLHHAIAGIGIEEHRYRALEAGVHEIRRKWLVTRDGLSQDDVGRLLSTKLPVKGNPEQFEIKGEDLLQARRIEKYLESGSSPSISVVLELLELVRLCRATTFGILSNPNDVDEILKSDGCPVQYIRLLDRINKWMLDAYPDRMAIPVFDNIHGGTNSHVSRQIGKYLYRHAIGKTMRRIVPTPFWIDSKSTAGSQVADVVAHILMNSMMPPNERKAIEFLWDLVVGMESTGSNYRTVTRLKRS